jgi:hypothetical protein
MIALPYVMVSRKKTAQAQIDRVEQIVALASGRGRADARARPMAPEPPR